MKNEHVITGQGEYMTELLKNLSFGIKVTLTSIIVLFSIFIIYGVYEIYKPREDVTAKVRSIVFEGYNEQTASTELKNIAKECDKIINLSYISSTGGNTIVLDVLTRPSETGELKLAERMIRITKRYDANIKSVTLDNLNKILFPATQILTKTNDVKDIFQKASKVAK